MNEKQSCMPFPEALKKMEDSDDLITTLLYVRDRPPCSLKVLWKSSQSLHDSFVFPKQSPLYPFFNYAYKKVRQTGGLHRAKEKWLGRQMSMKCDLNPMAPISIEKIGSLVALILFGIITAIIILAIEIINQKRFTPEKLSG